TSKKGYPVIQWEKDQTEMAGLIKTDILGNRGLAVIRDVINSLRLEGQADLDYQKIDAQSDLKTKELFIKGETVGVLHFESPRCRSLLGAMQSAKLSALSIVCSIIRPAALNQVNELLRRFRGGRFHWIHPKLKDILKSSYGVMVYQEDVMRVTRALAGFSNQEGNELRKVLAKKSKDKKLQYYRDKFFNGCAKEGLLPAQTQKLWEDIESFAGYSFCKPHSDSYSLVAFKSAYLKAHYPAHFFAAVISNQGGFYVGNVEDYLNEARRAGVAVLSPDVNLSHYEYSAVHSRSHRRGRGHGHMEIRTGLKQLKGVSSKTLKKIISYRESGPYKDLEDFLNRVNPPFHEARILAKARCFGSLRKVDERKLKNSEIMWMIYEWRAKREGSLDPRQKLPILLTDIKEHPKEKLIYWEREFLNGFVTFPSWFLYRDLLKRPHITPSSSIKNGDEKNWGREIILYGQKVSVKSVKTKHFEKMAFITFSDDCGMYNATFFPREYEEFRDLLRLEGSFLIKGKVEKDLNDWQIIVSDIQRVGEI
ncbi:MAG: OB-fold nucleic acid binding domain-containing protein, partial [Bacteriovoracaceae bacterium]